MRPIIGIVCDEDWERRQAQLYSGYYEGVFHWGGQPFLIPCLEDLDAGDIMSRLDGLMLTGGGDIDPRYFGETPHPHVGVIHPWRDIGEIRLAQAAERAGCPVLGICRGMQIMNIALGGDLYQDLGRQWQGKSLLCHDQKGPPWFGLHDVALLPDSRLCSILCADTVQVNSFHHQAVRTTGRGLRITGKTADGVPEALEHECHPFFIGVQWHPERMWTHSPIMGRLFDCLVQTAAGTSLE
jgi:putative glutamine amidotransferase